jgi:hypothetical protein
MQDWLSRCVELLTAKPGAYVRDGAADFLAEGRRRFHLLRDSQVTQSVVQAIESDH